MRTVTAHGKVLVELAEQASSLTGYFERRVIAEIDSEGEDGWVSIYMQRKHLDTVSAHLTEIARIARALKDEVLVDGEPE